MSSSDCRLLARAILLPSKQKIADDSTIIDSLVDQLESAVTISSKDVFLRKTKKNHNNVDAEGFSANSYEKQQCIERTEECSPADHLALQSLRSSALARKTNTTTKFSRNCRNLFADLMFGEEQQKKQIIDEKKEKVDSVVSTEFSAVPNKESEHVEEEKVKEVNQLKLLTEEECVNNSQKLLTDGKVDKIIKKKFSNEENLYDTANVLTQCNNESMNDKEDSCTKKTELIKQKEPVEGELIARGPVRASFIVHGANHQPFHHPYATTFTQHFGGVGHSPSISNRNMSSPNMAITFNAAAAPQTVLIDQSGLNPAVSFGYGYDCGIPTSNWSVDGWSVGGSDSALSSPSSTPDSIGTTLDPLSPGERSDRNELPDNLSDFILEYSRRYSPIFSRKASFSESDSPRSSGDTVTNGGESPFSAPKNSPSAPRNGAVCGGPQTPPFAPAPPLTSLTARDELGIINLNRQAKERLRVLIRSEDMDDAWAWTCKCIQRHPGALTFQDADRDTLLHIVTSHLDLAKIYTLVEQMLKMDGGEGEIPNFDIPNAMGETPLMVAVQKDQVEVVSYLLEAGASPNTQSNRLERHMPLHFAASHGMTKIVRALCADSRTKLNAEDGMGLSPLLCAFKNHGKKVSEKENNNLICNLEIINILLNSGANPFQVDATNGRTLAHYAVERMDERLLELLRAHLDEKQMAELVNFKDFCGETPMNTLKNVFDGKTELNENESLKRENIGLILITCGANSYKNDDIEELKEGY
ncbi:hypothetical protein ACQ4LE_002228 [Meloidogyne hapla]|uniref:ANK_REP_REGION domain-containing protein n=1 Tax=Meloidogyne hapla TaxID=6305 RepID=A0A1I8B7J7_MELHA